MGLAIRIELRQSVINTLAMTPTILLLHHMFFLVQGLGPRIGPKNQVECTVRDLHSLEIHVEDSDHLRISWEGVFLNCQDKDITAVVVKNTKNEDFIEEKDFGSMTASLKLDTCLTHSLYVQLKFVDNYNNFFRFPIMRSNVEDYSPLKQVCKSKGSGEPVVPEFLKDCLGIDWNRSANLVEVVSGSLKGDSVELEELSFCPQSIPDNNSIVTTVLVMGCVILIITSLAIAFWLCTKKREIIWQEEPNSNERNSVEFFDGYNEVTAFNPYDERPQASLRSTHGLHRWVALKRDLPIFHIAN